LQGLACSRSRVIVKTIISNSFIFFVRLVAHIVFIVIVRFIEMSLSSVMSCRNVSCDYDHRCYRYRLSSLHLFAVFVIVAMCLRLPASPSFIGGIVVRIDVDHFTFHMCHHNYLTYASALCNSCCHTLRVRPAIVVCRLISWSFHRVFQCH